MKKVVSLKKINKMDKILARLTKKRGRTNYQYQKRKRISLQRLQMLKE